MECLFFINPRSGGGAGQKLAEELETFQLPLAISKQIVFTDPSRLRSQVYSCASRKDLVVICGGDGTINGVISHLVNLNPIPTVAFIPLGTGNDIARSTGWYDSWERLGINGLYHAIKKAQTKMLDIWSLSLMSRECQKEYIFVAYAGFGCDGQICMEFMSLEGFLRKISLPPPTKRLFYIPPGLKALFREILGKTRFEFALKDCDSKDSVHPRRTAGQLLFINMPSYAGGTLILKDLDFSDGSIDCLAFKSCVEYLFKILFSGFKDSKGLSSHAKGDCFHIKIHQDVHFQVDGEPCGLALAETELVVRHRRTLPLLLPLRDDLARSRLCENEVNLEFEEGLVPSAKPAIT